MLPSLPLLSRIGRQAYPDQVDILTRNLDIKKVTRMARTVIDLDDELLAGVAAVLGTTTKRATVNTALREVLEARRRAASVIELRAVAEAGDLGLLLDKKNYRR